MNTTGDERAESVQPLLGGGDGTKAAWSDGARMPPPDVLRLPFGLRIERRTLWLIGLGQLISAVLCATGVLTTLLVNRGVETPCFQSFGMYLVLMVVYGSVLHHRGEFWPALRGHGGKFAVLALIDVEANYAIVKAYQYTNFTSAQLLDCTSIAFVLVLSRLFLKVQYTRLHLVGALVCVVGMGGIIAADAVSAGDENATVGKDPLLGDILCVIAAFLYACSNVGEEYAVKALDSNHFLGLLGLWGTVINGVQTLVLERDAIAAVEWTAETVALYIGFVLVLFTMYSLVPVLIARSSAVLFNLSLLTADVYSFVIGILFFKIEFYWLYFPAFVAVLAGIVIYTRAPERRGDAETDGPLVVKGKGDPGQWG